MAYMIIDRKKKSNKMMPSSFVLSLFIFIYLITLSAATSSSNPQRYRILAARDLSRYHNTITKTTTSQIPSPVTKHRRAALQYSYYKTQTTTPSHDVKYRKELTSIKLPLYSAADFGVGQYITELHLGTPARLVKLFVDTGSDLTWVKCRYHNENSTHKQFHDDDVFPADKSPSFKTVPCGSNQCVNELADMFSLTTCPSPSSPCLYNYSYESLSAFGLFGKETFTFPLITTNDYKTIKTTVHMGNLVGCTESTQGGNFINVADGILGLSYNNQSLGYNTANKFGGGKFSYCLVDHLSTTTNRSHFIFGDNIDLIMSKHIQHTDLLLGAINGFYAVNVNRLTVNGKPLTIPRKVWDVSTGGVIIDSGTSLTVLAPPAFKQVMNAMSRALSRRGFHNLKSTMDIQPFEYCFNSSTGFEDSMAPKLVVQFANGASFVPHVKSYLIDDRPGVKCVGILEGEDSVPYLSVFGNILTQNYVWEYDLKDRKLGFGPSDCAS